MTFASGVNLLSACKGCALRAQQLQRRTRPERGRSSHGASALCWVRWPLPTGTHSATFVQDVFSWFEPPREWQSLRKMMCKDVLFLFFHLRTLPLMICGCCVGMCRMGQSLIPQHRWSCVAIKAARSLPIVFEQLLDFDKLIAPFHLFIYFSFKCSPFFCSISFAISFSCIYTT